jgi:hypothetical protein
MPTHRNRSAEPWQRLLSGSVLLLYPAGSAYIMIVRPFYIEVLQPMLSLIHDAAYYTMWATWWSVIAIAVTGVIAYLAIRSGNVEKRRDRAIALFRLVQSDRYHQVAMTLALFNDLDANRGVWKDSWENKLVTYSTTAGVLKKSLPRTTFAPLLVQLLNIYEELYLHMKWHLVDDEVLLDAVCLLVLTDYYQAQPILAEVEDYTGFNFQQFRRFACRAQEWARLHEPRADARLLSVDTSDRVRS